MENIKFAATDFAGFVRPGLFVAEAGEEFQIWAGDEPATDRVLRIVVADSATTEPFFSVAEIAPDGFGATVKVRSEIGLGGMPVGQWPAPVLAALKAGSAWVKLPMHGGGQARAELLADLASTGLADLADLAG